jgi:hypothetical protein
MVRQDFVGEPFGLILVKGRITIGLRNDGCVVMLVGRRDTVTTFYG